MDLLDSVFEKKPNESEPPYYEPLRQRDFVAAVPLLMDAIRRDDAQAMALFATLLALGRGVKQNMQDAADWFRQAAVRGQVSGQAAYGGCLASGLGVERNDSEAAYWLFRSAQQGYSQAIEMLSNLALRNREVIGQHFSIEDFMGLMRKAKRPVRNSLH